MSRLERITGDLISGDPAYFSGGVLFQLGLKLYSEFRMPDVDSPLIMEGGFFVAHHIEGENLRFEVKQKLLDRYFPDKRSIGVPVPIPDFTGQLKRFAGLYRANLFCHTCKNPPSVAEVEVRSNDDGTITVWDHRWVQTTPLFFVRLDGKRKIGFQEDKTGRILQMSAGSWKVLEKVK